MIAILAGLAAFAGVWPASAIDNRTGAGVVTNGYYRPCQPANFNSASIGFDFAGRMPFKRSAYQVIGRAFGSHFECSTLNEFYTTVEGMNALGESFFTVCYLKVTTVLPGGTIGSITVHPTLRLDGRCNADDRDFSYPNFSVSAVLQPAGVSDADGTIEYRPLVGAYIATYD